jgi:hypothetical protein
VAGETNGDGDSGEGEDSNDFRTPADYDDLQRLSIDIDELGVAEQGIGRSLSAFGGDVAFLEQDQVAAFWSRYHRVRADADELRAELEAESLRLTKRPILRPPWHL